MSLTVIKALPFPWTIGGHVAKDVEVRPALMEDVCNAELEATPMRPNSFNIQMACLQVVRAGGFTGPFAPGHFKGMRAAQFSVIAAAMQEADQMGEDVSADGRTTTEK